MGGNEQNSTIAICARILLFQALGKTLPPLLPSATRSVSVLVPVLWLAGHAGFELRTIWILSSASVVLHAAANLGFVHRQIRRQEAIAAP